MNNFGELFSKVQFHSCPTIIFRLGKHDFLAIIQLSVVCFYSVAAEEFRGNVVTGVARFRARDISLRLFSAICLTVKTVQSYIARAREPYSITTSARALIIYPFRANRGNVPKDTRTKNTLLWWPPRRVFDTSLREFITGPCK